MSDPSESPPSERSRRGDLSAIARFAEHLAVHPARTALLAVLCAGAGLSMVLGWVPDSAWRTEGQRLFRAWSVAALWWSLGACLAFASYRGFRRPR